jgi:hypothetical protein
MTISSSYEHTIKSRAAILAVQPSALALAGRAPAAVRTVSGIIF